MDGIRSGSFCLRLFIIAKYIAQYVFLLIHLNLYHQNLSGLYSVLHES